MNTKGDMKRVNLSELVCNDRNPRSIRTQKFAKLVDSVLTFPKMLSLRPIVVDGDNLVLGGNMRLHALEEIQRLVSSGELESRAKLVQAFRTTTQEQQSELLKGWKEWYAQGCPVMVADAAQLTREECDEFIIKDNVSAGEWSWNDLGNWDSLKLNNWGLDVWGAEPEEETNDGGEGESAEKPAETSKEHKLKVTVTLNRNSDYDDVFDVIEQAVKGFDCIVK